MGILWMKNLSPGSHEISVNLKLQRPETSHLRLSILPCSKLNPNPLIPNQGKKVVSLQMKMKNRRLKQLKPRRFPGNLGWAWLKELRIFLINRRQISEHLSKENSENLSKSANLCQKIKFLTNNRWNNHPSAFNQTGNGSEKYIPAFLSKQCFCFKPNWRKKGCS